MKESKPLTHQDKLAISLAKRNHLQKLELEAHISDRSEKAHIRKVALSDELFGDFFSESYDGPGHYLIPFTLEITVAMLEKVINLSSKRFGISITWVKEYDIKEHSELCVLIEE